MRRLDLKDGERVGVGADPFAPLVKAIAEAGDRDAFRQLFLHYGPRVKGYLLRLGLDPARADELVQEVMVAVWRKAGSFDSRQATVSTWIFRIARNRRIDVFRRDQTARLDESDPSLLPPPLTDPADEVDAGQRQAKVSAALDLLPREQRDLVRQAFYEELSHSEIAEATGLALGTVKSRLRLAFGKLRAALQELT
jgi:RNA polymerase sigma-70 factor (ECF subfamily)